MLEAVNRGAFVRKGEPIKTQPFEQAIHRTQTNGKKKGAIWPPIETRIN